MGMRWTEEEGDDAEDVDEGVGDGGAELDDEGEGEKDAEGDDEGGEDGVLWNTTTVPIPPARY